MDDDLDRLRGRDDARDPLEDPLIAYQPSNRVPWVGFLVLLVLVALGVWYWAPRTARSPAEAVGRLPTEEVVTPDSSGADLAAGMADPNLPPLGGELDAYVRPLLSALSSRPELAALLASDDLVRRFVVSVDAVGRGESPARQVRALSPRTPFQVRPEGATLVVDPASYERYSGLIELVDQLDPAALARVYGRLKPRLEEAYGELGTGTTLDEAITRAIGHLLQTPVPPARPHVKPGRGTNYVFADPAFEGLSAAQKQLLRTGPAGVTRIQARLRAFASALGR